MSASDPTTPELVLLRYRDAAKLLSISERALWTLANCGQIPTVRIGKAVRFRRETLEAWAAQQETAGNVRHSV